MMPFRPRIACLFDVLLRLTLELLVQRQHGACTGLACPSPSASSDLVHIGQSRRSVEPAGPALDGFPRLSRLPANVGEGGMQVLAQPCRWHAVVGRRSAATPPPSARLSYRTFFQTFVSVSFS